MNLPFSKHENHPDIKHRIFEEPQEGCFYAAALDPAGAASSGHPAVIHVWCDKPRKLVCEVRGHAHERIWAKELYDIGKFYNWAYINCEVFRFGQIVRESLIMSNPLYGIPEPYPHIYRSPTNANLKAGLHTPRDSKVWMYPADATRRPIMIAQAQQAVVYAFESNEADVIPDEEFLRELDSMFINMRTGRQESAPGETDDRIIATALCWLIFKQEPFDYSTDVTQERSFSGIDENGNVYIDIQAEYEASNFMPKKDEVIYG